MRASHIYVMFRHVWKMMEDILSIFYKQKKIFKTFIIKSLFDITVFVHYFDNEVFMMLGTFFFFIQEHAHEILNILMIYSVTCIFY